MDINRIKLVIWDLDETFWKGTLSEGNVEVTELMNEFLHQTLDMGIVHSICSKNDYQQAKEKLVELGLWDLFVFPSIDWTTKGPRVKAIVESMRLRPENVVFIDDNTQNLEEVKYFCGELMTISPGDIRGLLEQSRNCKKTDISHKRLAQYKILQEKEVMGKSFESNEGFLKSCNIRVDICRDCMENIDRIHELLMRSNQLNYTKFRQGKDELMALLQDNEADAGYVKVSDNFGDYGIVGFFAVRRHKAIHYLFSCRILGMAVEQYVYMKMGCPELQVVGEIAVPVNKEFMPDWINQPIISDGAQRKKSVATQAILKGPCDLCHVFTYIHHGKTVVTEFTYVNDKGVTIEGHNHTGQIVTALCSEDQRKTEIINDIGWFDMNMLSTRLMDEDIQVVVLSLLTDANLGLYRRKATGEQIALCEKCYDLTDPTTWELYIHKKIFTSNIDFSEKDLREFADKYEYVFNDGTITIDNLDTIYNYIKHKKFVLILGSEREYHGETYLNYRERAMFHKRLNEMVREWASTKNNVVLLPIDKYIFSEDDFTDTINHFKKVVYYRFANDLIPILDGGANEIRLRGKGTFIYEVAKEKVRFLLQALKKHSD